MSEVQRLVVKIGSSALTTQSHKLDDEVVTQLVEDVVELRSQGLEVAIVTSGAVAAGMGRWSWTNARTTSLNYSPRGHRQVLLMDVYKDKFRRQGVPIGPSALNRRGHPRRPLSLRKPRKHLSQSLMPMGPYP